MGNTDTISKLKTLECDPIELSANIALGKSNTFEHPNFSKIKRAWRGIKTQIKNRELSMKSLNDFWKLVEISLQHAPPTEELRSKHILELMQHVSAKQKSVMNTNVEHYVNSLDEVPDELLERVLAGDSDIDLTGFDNA